MDNLYDKIDKKILKSLPNPSNGAYEIKIKIPEFTFLGVSKQPDFATMYLTFYPKDKIIEHGDISIMRGNIEHIGDSPELYNDIIGLRANINIKKNEPIKIGMFKPK